MQQQNFLVEAVEPGWLNVLRFGCVTSKWLTSVMEPDRRFCGIGFPPKLLNTALFVSSSGHYNPYNAPIGTPSYSSTCGAASHLGCEVGDLSSKHVSENIILDRKYSRHVQL